MFGDFQFGPNYFSDSGDEAFFLLPFVIVVPADVPVRPQHLKVNRSPADYLANESRPNAFPRARLRTVDFRDSEMLPTVKTPWRTLEQ